MRIEWMRSIDRWVGGSLVILLAPLASLRRRSPIPHHEGVGPNPPAARRPAARGRLPEQPVLVVSKYFGLGSLILLTPLLRQLKAAFPQAHLILLTFASNQELASLIPEIDEVVPIRSGAARVVWDSLKALARLWRRRVHVFIDAEFFSRYTALMSVGSGAVVRVGFHTMSLRSRGRLLTHRVYWNPHRYAADNFLALGAALGLPSSDGRVALRDLTPTELEEGLGWLKERGLSPGRYLVFSPRADVLRELKSYPEAGWRTLAERLHQRTGHAIVFVGSRVDPQWSALRGQAHPSVHNLSGKTNLTTLIAVLRHAACLVSVDSGVAHLAGVLRVPTLALFGPETPTLYGPINPRGEVLYANLHCSPCVSLLEGKQSDCEDNVCINRWSADALCEKALSLMRGRASVGES